MQRRKKLLAQFDKGKKAAPEKTDASKAEKFKNMVKIYSIFQDEHSIPLTELEKRLETSAQNGL